MSAHLIPTLAVFLITTVGAAWLVRGLSSRETGVAWASFFAHWVSAFALYWLMISYYNGIGDVLTFFRTGEALAQYARVVPGGWRDLVSLTLQQDVYFPFDVRGVGRSTGTMNGLAAFLMLTVRSKYAAGGLMACFAFSGKLALYRYFRALLPSETRVSAMLAVMLLPSAVFWTSGLVKEAVATTGLGWGLYAIERLRRARWRSPGWMAVVAVSLAFTAATKTYLMVPLAGGVVVWLTLRPVKEGDSPSIWRWVAGFAVGFLAVIIIGQIFPRFSLEQVGDEIASMQERGAAAGGGSYMQVGDPAARGLGQQLLFAPLGLLSVLFRPFLFEIRGAAMAINGLETFVLTVFMGRTLWRHKAVAIWRTVRGEGALMLCVGFVLVAGVGVGLTTTNMGSLSRYRVPLMPFYVTALVVTERLLASRKKRRRSRTRSATAPAAVAE